VDHVSPFATGDTPSRDQVPNQPLTAAEAQQAVAMLNRAFGKVQAISPRAAELITRFTRTIVVRRHGDEAGWIGSWSSFDFVGRTTLCFHPDRCDDGRLASSLIHEAIHALLYTVEHTRPFVVDRRDRTAAIRSPWSGNLLAPSSFTHAVLVWFGLRRFWEEARRSGLFEEAVATEQLTAARRGFESPDLDRRLAEARPSMTEDYQALVERLSPAAIRSRSSPTRGSLPPPRSPVRR
jgi:HEXXH motif-containing protein